jgi:predicted  nucleic acid-binding Zn-ribbon protein
MPNPEQAARENLAQAIELHGAAATEAQRAAASFNAEHDKVKAQAKKLDELKARDEKLAGEIADALLGGNDVNYLNRENQTIHQDIRQAEDSLRTMKIMLASLAAKHESAERKTEECQKHVSAARTEIVSIQSDRLATALALALIRHRRIRFWK